MPNTVLILGASGRFGRNAADAFAAKGWTVHRFDRQTDHLETAAKGVDVIVAAWHLPYQDWATQVPTLHAGIRKAALDNDATVILPGNVYVFGPKAPHPWSENTPHMATNPLARIRQDTEHAYRRDGVKTIVLRTGDFLDTEPSGNWFDMIMTKKLHKGRFTYPGHTDRSHAWGFLPDIARAAVELAEMRARLNTFEDIPFPGLTLSGDQMAQVLTHVMGHKVRARRMSWLPLRLAWPFIGMIRYLFEMRYLWDLPHTLDGTRFSQLLPDFQMTPAAQALAAATAHLR